MISRIGSSAGFTLVEALAAAAVLSLGIVLIYESYFISLDAYNYCDDYMKAVSWVDEKVWEAADNITRTRSLKGMDRTGSFRIGDKGFNWILSFDPIEGMDKVYKTTVVLSGDRGKRPLKISRIAYAIYEEKE